VQTSNKKGLNFLILKKNQGQCSNVEEEESSDDGDDDTRGSFDDEFAFLQHVVVCSIQDDAAIPKGWILLDSQSTVDVFSNAKLLTNVHDMKRNLVLYCNVGKAIISNKGDLKGYGSVWFYPDIIANILSLSKVQCKHKVMYNSNLNQVSSYIWLTVLPRYLDPPKRAVFL